MTPRPRNRDLDYLKGLADKRAEVLVGLPGLGAATPATVMGMRWNPTGEAGELTLGVPTGSELAALMARARERGDRLEQMTIGTRDRAAGVGLGGLTVARIDDRQGSAVLVQLTSTSLGGRVGTIPKTTKEVPS
jgi:hypothetical protein